MTPSTVLTDLEVAAENLRGLAVTDDELIDAAGRLSAIERKLAEIRRGYLAETSPAAVGETFRAKVSRSASRTYNVPAILASTAEARGISIEDALRFLAWDIDDPVLKVSVRWTQLKRAFAALGSELRVGARELDPAAVSLDDPHVGEVWTEKVSPEAITPDTI